MDIIPLGRVLDSLISGSPQRVTYDEIESAMRSAGLDPFSDGEAYEAIIEALADQQVPVVDGGGALTRGAVRGLSAAEIADEVVAELNGVLEATGGHARRLLTAGEERRLLEIYHDSLNAASQKRHIESDEDAYHLDRRIRAGQEALEELTRRNIGLVTLEAIRASKRARFLDVDDLIQEGFIGFYRATQKFDLECGGRLSTYAMFWIRQAIGRALLDQDRLIRLPIHRQEMMRHLKRVEDQLIQTFGRDPTDAELAESLGQMGTNPIASSIPSTPLNGNSDSANQTNTPYTQALVKLLRHWNGIDSVGLEIPIGEIGETVLGDLVPDPYALDPLEYIWQQQLRNDLTTCLESLKPREREILASRFGLADGHIHTLAEIAGLHEVTRERVRQIEQRGLRKLRHPRWKRILKGYLKA